MNEDFTRLDELLTKNEADFTAVDTEDLERLAPLLVDPAYQEHRWALMEAASKGITGEFDGPQPKNEAEHFEVCPQCGQAIDARDLKEVLRHLQPGHKTATPDA